MGVVRKSKQRSVRVQSVREPSIITEMGDVDFGTLDATKDGHIVSYDSTSKKFVLITADELLGVAAEDNDVPDQLVSVLESEIDLGQVQIQTLDGGTF